MKNVFLVFTTDAWHSNDSKTFAGAFTSTRLAIKAIQEHAKTGNQEEEGDQEITAHDLELLETIRQTQGRSENYIIDSETLNAERLFF